MPLWLERLVNRNVGVEFLPLLLCIGGVVAVWWWQWSRGVRRARAGVSDDPISGVRVGWGVGSAVVVLTVAALAWCAVSTGLWRDALDAMEEDPRGIMWWVVAVGCSVCIWGVASHAWRGEARLARQCRRCGYDMTALPGVLACPECGRVARGERDLRPRRVRRWAVRVGLVIAVLGLAVPSGLGLARRGPAGAAPNWLLSLWVTRVDGLPMSVQLEVGYRASKDRGAWMERFEGDAPALVRRALRAAPTDRPFYVALLQGKRLGAEALGVALDGLRSADAGERGAAAEVLVETGPVIVPLELLWPVIEGADAGAAAKARWLIAWQSRAMLQAVTGDGAHAGQVRDVESLRRYLRALMDVGSIADEWEKLQWLSGHFDPEVSARATVLMASMACRTGVAPPSLLRRAVAARETLDSLGASASLQPHCRTACWVWWGRAGGVDGMGTLLADNDPAMRRALYRQLAPTEVIPVRSSWAQAIKPWEDLLPALEERQKTEGDPAALSELVKLIGSIKTPPSGQTP